MTFECISCTIKWQKLSQVCSMWQDKSHKLYNFESAGNDISRASVCARNPLLRAIQKCIVARLEYQFDSDSKFFATLELCYIC